MGAFLASLLREESIEAPDGTLGDVAGAFPGLRQCFAFAGSLSSMCRCNEWRLASGCNRNSTVQKIGQGGTGAMPARGLVGNRPWKTMGRTVFGLLRKRSY